MMGASAGAMLLSRPACAAPVCSLGAYGRGPERAAAVCDQETCCVWDVMCAAERAARARHRRARARKPHRCDTPMQGHM